MENLRNAVITTVTLNPMLDKTVRVHGIVRGGIMRATGMDVVVGGKGINVSRQLRMLGMETTATGFLGGEIGTMLGRLMDAESLCHAFVRVEGMTREGVTYLDDDGVMTALFEPPHAVTAEEVDRLVAQCGQLAAGSRWIACCGSSPATAADRAYGEIIRMARERGVATALDSYGTPLRMAMEAGPTLVKVNRHEWEQTFGDRLDSEPAILALLGAQRRRGIDVMVLTDGDAPCYMAAGDHKWKALPPRMRAVNATGSGDSMLAAMLFGLEQGWPPARWFAFGVAAGAANASVRDVARSTRSAIDDVVPMVGCTQLC